MVEAQVNAAIVARGKEAEKKAREAVLVEVEDLKRQNAAREQKLTPHEHGRTLPLVAVGDNRIGKVAMTKLAAVGKNEKMEVLYQYLSGVEFRERVEAIVEAFIEMQEDLQEERHIAEKCIS